jgi:hypothetical protein
MAQDLRNLFKDEHNNSQLKMSKGHEARFLNKLDKAMATETSIKKRFSVLKIAASIVVLIGLAFTAYKISQQPKSIENTVVVNENQTKGEQLKSLGDISPDFKKVEDYYLAHINLEFSKIKQTPENKEIFDGYVIRLAELNQEYKRLSVELTENGPNELTVSALIDNLKLRLNLLYRLKEQLQYLNALDEAKINS